MVASQNQDAVRLLFFEVEVVVFRWKVRPNLFDTLVGLAVILHGLKVFHDLIWCACAISIINQLQPRGRPWCIFEMRCQIKGPVHLKQIGLVVARCSDNRCCFAKMQGVPTGVDSAPEYKEKVLIQAQSKMSVVRSAS